MRARVTVLAPAARGLQTQDRGTVLLEPGASAFLDLADHAAHDAWAAAGEVVIEPAPEGDDKPGSRPRPPARGGKVREA